MVFLKTKITKLNLWNYLTASKNCDREYQESTDSNAFRKNDRRYFNLKHNTNKNIIVVQYTMVHYINLF